MTTGALEWEGAGRILIRDAEALQQLCTTRNQYIPNTCNHSLEGGANSAISDVTHRTLAKRRQIIFGAGIYKEVMVNSKQKRM